MRSKVLPALSFFVPTLLGLGVSAVLLVDYLGSSSVFCADGSGCEAVRRTSLAAPFGVPTPLTGLFGFGLLGALFLARGGRARAAHCAIGLLGAMVGLALIAVQVAIGHACLYCFAADLSACALGVAALWRFRNGWDLGARILVRTATGAVLALTPTVVMGLGFSAQRRVPRVIESEILSTPKGFATVVEFVDFECPYCRMEQDELAPMLDAEKGRVHIVRKLVPLVRLHPHAMDAARAACCAEILGKGDAMAAALFRAPIEQLTSVGCEKIAMALGLDEARYTSCIADPKTDERIAADRRVFDRAASKGDGLPLLWIGDKKIMGAEDASALRHALDVAIAKAGS